MPVRENTILAVLLGKYLTYQTLASQPGRVVKAMRKDSQSKLSLAHREGACKKAYNSFL